MSKVVSLNKEAIRPKAGELSERIHSLIKEYDGEIGFVEAIGVLEFLKSVMIEKQLENLSGD